MTENLARLQRELDATLHYLRTQAATHLPYKQYMRAVRESHALCDGLLQALEIADPSDLAPLDDATDELLNTDAAGTEDLRSRVEPLDDGPEGTEADSDREPSSEEGFGLGAGLAAGAAAISAGIATQAFDMDDAPTKLDRSEPQAGDFFSDDEAKDTVMFTGARPTSSGQGEEEGGDDADDLMSLFAQDSEQDDAMFVSIDEPEETEETAIPAADTESVPQELAEEDEVEVEIEDEDEVVLIEDDEPSSDFDDAPATEPGVVADALQAAGDAVDTQPLDDFRPEPEVETFDLLPDISSDLDEGGELEDLQGDSDLHDQPPPLVGPSDEDVDDEPSELEVVMNKGAPEPRVAPTPQVRPAGAAVSTTSRSRAGVSAGLYSGPNVPQIRDGDAAAPRAAAVKIGAQAATPSIGSSALGFEEDDEVIELGDVEDYGEDADDYDSEDGFSLNVQEYEEEEEEYEYEEEEAPQAAAAAQVQAAPAPPPVPTGPSAAELAAMLKKAQDAVEAGDMQMGVDLFSDVLDADPDHVEALIGRGRLHLDFGDYTRAMSDFIIAEELDPKNPEPQVAVGDLFFARKDYRKAIEYFNAALEMAPRHAMAFCRRGISHYYRKNYPQALDDLKHAQKLDADIPNIRTYIAMAKKKAKR